MTLPVLQERVGRDERIGHGEDLADGFRLILASVLGLIVTIGAVVLAHVAPFPFLFDVTDETVWRMPRTATPTVYLTFDDGPNPEATPQLLDVLARHGVRATFFVTYLYIST